MTVAHRYASRKKFIATGIKCEIFGKQDEKAKLELLYMTKEEKKLDMEIGERVRVCLSGYGK